MSTNMKFTGMEVSVISSPSLDSYHYLSFIMSTAVLFQCLSDAPSSPQFGIFHTSIYTFCYWYMISFFFLFIWHFLYSSLFTLFYYVSQSLIYSSSHVLLYCHVKHFLVISSIIYLGFFYPLLLPS